MVIKNIGDVKSTFQKLEFEDWTKKVDAKSLGISDLPNVIPASDRIG